MSKFAICVELGNSNTLGGRNGALRQLNQLLDQHRIAATWAIEDIDGLSFVKSLPTTAIRHQVALNLSVQRPHTTTSIRLIDQRLEKLLAPFRQADIDVRTALIPSIPQMHSHFGPMARQGLTTLIVASDIDRTHPIFRRMAVEPHRLPLGLWQLPTNVHLPSRHPWLSRLESACLPASRPQVLERTAQHVQISAGQVTAQPGPTLRQIGKLLHQVAWAASRRQVEVVTASAWTDEIARQATVQPQQSILKIAA